MRTDLKRFLPAATLAFALGACGIPGDGKTDVRGEVFVAASVLPLVVQPGSGTADGDCTDDTPWGEVPAVGDVSPTVYIGFYPQAIDSRENNLFNPDNLSDAWRHGCGEFDLDDDPITPPDVITGGCPLGGTTGVYVNTIAGSNGGAVFEFEALNLERGSEVYAFAWVDNRCHANNSPTSNLVWDLGGPPSPMDQATGDEIDSNDFDIVSVAGPLGPFDMSGASTRIDEQMVLDTALSAVGF